MSSNRKGFHKNAGETNLPVDLKIETLETEEKSRGEKVALQSLTQLIFSPRDFALRIE
jgi:hypothetical protein